MCSKPFLIGELQEHERECARVKCNNELCGVELRSLLEKPEKRNQVIRFEINNRQYLVCSKKCKKITKFSYILKKNDEKEVLKTFEAMLRKKIQKNLEHA
jgi:Tfp pilus assembly pilus retraction ATPase PilT